jgi:2-C-methyl-D-erythritol 4-phosphate cytidylyltransferase
VDDATIDRVVRAVRDAGDAGDADRGVVAALPVVDTLKAVDAEGRVTHTVPRESLWRAQTPQGFSRALIERAHRDAKASGVDATDDAGLCERIGVPVVVVRGSERAMKITEEADFARVEALFGLAQ